ncbi:MAG: hypothetical protein WCT12_22395, partial [Verrucomicrobiota bacterium]
GLGFSTTRWGCLSQSARQVLFCAVLELGWANGNQLLPLAASGYDCTGVDVSKRALQNLAETHRLLEQ